MMKEEPHTNKTTVIRLKALYLEMCRNQQTDPEITVEELLCLMAKAPNFCLASLAMMCLQNVLRMPSPQVILTFSFVRSIIDVTEVGDSLVQLPFQRHLHYVDSLFGSCPFGNQVLVYDFFAECIERDCHNLTDFELCFLLAHVVAFRASSRFYLTSHSPSSNLYCSILEVISTSEVAPAQENTKPWLIKASKVLRQLLGGQGGVPVRTVLEALPWQSCRAQELHKALSQNFPAGCTKK
jgi:hypothetical protein